MVQIVRNREESEMKNGFTLVELLWVIFILYMCVAWVTNLVRFCNLDFEESYKAEVLRGIGIATPLFLVTAFADIGEENEE